MAPLLPMPMRGEQQRADMGGVFGCGAVKHTKVDLRSSHETVSRVKKMDNSPYRASLETDNIPCITSSKIFRVVQEAKPIQGDRKPARPGIFQKSATIQAEKTLRRTASV